MDIFSPNELEQIAKILGGAATARELHNFLENAQIEFVSQESTKWRFLKDCFIEDQKTYACWNHILTFIQLVLDPIRFTENSLQFEDLRLQLNNVLRFKGIEYTKEKQFRQTPSVRSLDDLPKIWRTRLVNRDVLFHVLT